MISRVMFVWRAHLDLSVLSVAASWSRLQAERTQVPV
jgi:hypothetical protein